MQWLLCSPPNNSTTGGDYHLFPSRPFYPKRLIRGVHNIYPKQQYITKSHLKGTLKIEVSTWWGKEKQERGIVHSLLDLIISRNCVFFCPYTVHDWDQSSLRVMSSFVFLALPPVIVIPRMPLLTSFMLLMFLMLFLFTPPFLSVAFIL